ncbi:MAG: CcmD family protein [SAR202 cluster bacterium]|nr:CcmD family protein [SAR202 cluster bacterium]
MDSAKWFSGLIAAPLPLLPVAQPQQAPGESNLPYLFVVYLVTWLVFFAYAFYMNRKQQALQRDLDALRKQFEDGDRQRGPSPRRPS